MNPADENNLGCDQCQQVCPHNHQSTIPPDNSFTLHQNLLNITPETILTLTKSTFHTLFKGTPIYRTGLKRLKRNACAVAKNLKKT